MSHDQMRCSYDATDSDAHLMSVESLACTSVHSSTTLPLRRLMACKRTLDGSGVSVSDCIQSVFPNDMDAPLNT